MTPSKRRGKTAQGVQPFDANKLIHDLETLAAPGTTIDGPGYLVSSVLADQQEQLAQELLGLVVELRNKLELYLDFQTSSSTDDTVKLETEAAVEWMGQTIEDLVATIVGLESTSWESADPVAS
ncbi:hypothetical protein [Arthrobacter sp. TWP1-1]|uniref:hypothetical protein n=1 Tax=Arthrobacter sp. TWP1-1 TaxID=2804568 RepID=UPI003CEF6C33